MNPRSDRVREDIAHRARAYMAVAVDGEYRRRLARWAADDTAPYPNRDTVAHDVRAELEVLASALGVWAAVDPSELFEPRSHGDTEHGREDGHAQPHLRCVFREGFD